MSKTPYHKLSVVFLLIIFNITELKGQVPLTTAIDFTVKDLNSNTHHLYEYLDAGKIVVIDFFTTSCGPCQTYAAQISDAYDYFGCNQGNVIFLGINWGSDNHEVRIFDSIWNARYPSVSGLQGGGNRVVDSFQVQSYPTVIVITPDKNIATNYIWPPAYDSIVNRVTLAGGVEAPCTVSAVTQSSMQAIHLQTTNHSLHFTFRETDNYTVTVYTIDGKNLISYTISGTPTHIIQHNLKKGIYFAVVQSKKGKSQTLKFII